MKGNEIMNNVEFEVYGDFALFSDPNFKASGAKTSYLIPTYEAIKGVCKSIYWKPTFVWVIDEVRIMNPIKTESMGVRFLKDCWKGKTDEVDLETYMYLKDVKYQVKAHIEWNTNRKELFLDRNMTKHISIINRMIEKGGRRDVFLGTRECQAYVEPCKYNSGEGYYDNDNTLEEDEMFHSFTYADEAYSTETQGWLTKNFWQPKIEYGKIKFCTPARCKHERLHEMDVKPFGVEYNNFTIEEVAEEV